MEWGGIAHMQDIVGIRQPFIMEWGGIASTHRQDIVGFR